MLHHWLRKELDQAVVTRQLTDEAEIRAKEKSRRANCSVSPSERDVLWRY